MRYLVRAILIVLFITANIEAFNYYGTWFNTNPNTNGVTKIVIKSNGIIRAYGKCHPTNCDWGSRHYLRVKSGLLASWRHNGGLHEVLLVEPSSANKIRVIEKYLFCDRRADKTKIEYFKKLPVVHAIDKRDRFTGSWVSTNPNTSGLTKAKIYKSQRGIYVHFWGKCHPRDCDWGNRGARIDGNVMSVVWNQGFVRRVIKIRGLNYANGKYNKLKITSTNYYNDRRGVRTTVDYLRRVY